MKRQKFVELTEKITILDGATGTIMMAKGMLRAVCVEDWLLQHPEDLMELQAAYAAAGSQIVYAPTFSANRISLAKYGLEGEVKRINSGLVELTRRAVGEGVRVAGDMTTTGEVLEPLGELEREELLEAYKEQADAILEAGADLIVAETLMDVREAEIALEAVRSLADVPFMATLAVQEDGRSFFGGSATDLIKQMGDMGADAAGINCSMGPDKLLSLVRELASFASIPLIVKPNAGMPVVSPEGRLSYPMGREEFADLMVEMARIGVRIVGGCCGTDPGFIREMKTRLELAGLI